MNEASTQNLTPSRQRDKLNAHKGSKIQAGFETSGEMPGGRISNELGDRIVTAEWLLRLYLQRQDIHTARRQQIR